MACAILRHVYGPHWVSSLARICPCQENRRAFQWAASARSFGGIAGTREPPCPSTAACLPYSGLEMLHRWGSPSWLPILAIWQGRGICSGSELWLKLLHGFPCRLLSVARIHSQRDTEGRLLLGTGPCGSALGLAVGVLEAAEQAAGPGAGTQPGAGGLHPRSSKTPNPGGSPSWTQHSTSLPD